MLSSHEVSLGYKEVQDPSVYIRFAVHGAENTYFLAWTTTPWTLISNAALAVGPDVQYVKIRLLEEGEGEKGGEGERERGGEVLILAGRRLEVIKQDYEILAAFALVGRSTPFGV